MAAMSTGDATALLLFLRIAATELYERVPSAKAFPQAASSGSIPQRFLSPRMPMQERNPCSGVWARTQDDLDRRGGVIADCCGVALDPLMRPVAIAPVRTRHVFSQCRRSMRAQAAQMRRHQLAAVEDLHGVGGDARLHFLAQQAKRYPYGCC